MRERLDSLWRDVRHSLRALRRAPRFVTTAVFTLALGLGSTTVIVSLVDHIALRPLPYADDDRLFVVREIVGRLRASYPTMPANASHFLEWRRACTVCEGIAAVRSASYTYTGDGDPQRLAAVRVSANLLSVLGVQPALGRGFRPDEEQEGRDGVIMLSDAFWRRQFGSDRSVVGRTIVLNDVAAEIVGVLPRGFSVPGAQANPGIAPNLDVYRPLALSTRERTHAGWFDYLVITRLRRGATVEQARAQLDQVQTEFARRDANGTLQAAVIPLQQQVVGGAGRPLLLLLGAVIAVLLIVTVNLANLMLVRSSAREHEWAIRIALGAGRARLARLALAESLIVTLAGGVLGVVLAHWGLRALIALAPATMPRIAEVSLDVRVLSTGALVSLAVALGIGALPAMRAGLAAPSEALKAGGRTATNSRATVRRRALFIGLQVAFSTVLLVGAGLFLASFVRVLRVERGFETDRVLALDVVLSSRAYPTDTSRAQGYDRMLAAVKAVPGVRGVAVASALPLEGESWMNAVRRADDVATEGDRPSANFRFVSPDYFGVMGTPVRGGRVFAESDRTRPTVVLSQRAAHVLWPDGSAIGQWVDIGFGRPFEVLGVVADVHTSTLEQEGALVVYVPAWLPPSQGAIVVRTTGDPGAVAAAARDAIRRIDRSVPVPRVRTMDEVVSKTVAPRRFQLALLALFAVLALVTASVGIYGVIAQSLSSRTREIGVRMALGARPWDVHRLVLREALTPVALGLAVGVVGAYVAASAVRSLLFEVQPGDPRTILSVGLLLGTVAVIACVIPSRRVTRTGAASLLRTE